MNVCIECPNCGVEILAESPERQVDAESDGSVGRLRGVGVGCDECDDEFDVLFY